jgi:hypothetical protein
MLVAIGATFSALRRKKTDVLWSALTPPKPLLRRLVIYTPCEGALLGRSSDLQA